MKKSNDHNNSSNKNIKKLSSNNASDEENHKVELLFLGEYYNMFTRQMSPITKRFIEQESSRIMEWAQLQDSLRMVDYTDARGYTPEVYYDWVKKYPEIKIAHEFALRRIGSRREQGAMTRQFSEGTIHRTLGYYDQIFACETLKLSKMKDEISSEGRVVIIERFPSSHAQDIEVISLSKLSPEEVAAQIHKQTGDQRVVRVNTKNIGDDYEE
jgi:hypothetical protein